MIVKDTCCAVWEQLHEEFIPHPTTQHWLEFAENCLEVCQFPNCVGALYGKHIRIIKAIGTGSEYFKSKKYFSIILMAIADAQYRFVAVDVGTFGRTNDSMVFKSSSILVLGNPLPGSDGPPMPFVLVADEAFQMCGNLIKPYSSLGLNHMKRNFNCRLTRARRIVECSFGILVSKWRSFTKPIQVKIESIDEVVKACVVLHNYLLTKEPLLVEHVVDESNLTSLEHQGLRTTVAVSRMRDAFAHYFISDAGRVD